MRAMHSLLSSIPSPSIGRLSLGPFGVSAYGLMIAFGVIAGTALASRRLERTGAGTTDDMQSIALWSVLGGLIGARLYHVITASGGGATGGIRSSSVDPQPCPGDWRSR